MGWGGAGPTRDSPAAAEGGSVGHPGVPALQEAIVPCTEMETAPAGQGHAEDGHQLLLRRSHVCEVFPHRHASPEAASCAAVPSPEGADRGTGAGDQPHRLSPSGSRRGRSQHGRVRRSEQTRLQEAPQTPAPGNISVCFKEKGPGNLAGEGLLLRKLKQQKREGESVPWCTASAEEKQHR